MDATLLLLRKYHSNTHVFEWFGYKMTNIVVFGPTFMRVICNSASLRLANSRIEKPTGDVFPGGITLESHLFKLELIRKMHNKC